VAIVVSEIGERALAAVTASGGTARVLAPLTRSIYLTAGDEILWLASESAGHARAMVATLPEPPPAPGVVVAVAVEGARRWRPSPIAAPSPATLASGARALAASVEAIGAPGGFGALLAGRLPAFPLDGAVDTARALATACAADDPEAAARAAVPLLGLGPGLTPAGDDYVGGAFFARAVLRAAGADRGHRWARAAAAVAAAGRARTHPISAALLGDLLAGDGYGPLHDLASALAARTSALEAARRLTRLGHSSGWDVLAGFLSALIGRFAPSDAARSSAGFAGATGLGEVSEGAPRPLRCGRCRVEPLWTRTAYRTTSSPPVTRSGSSPIS
jgi:hypothetical protein